MKKPLGLRLDEGLIARIDGVRGEGSRTAWVEAAIEAALGGSPVVDRASVVPARGVGGSRVASSASAKLGVVPRWRGGDGSA